MFFLILLPMKVLACGSAQVAASWHPGQKSPVPAGIASTTRSNSERATTQRTPSNWLTCIQVSPESTATARIGGRSLLEISLLHLTSPLSHTQLRLKLPGPRLLHMWRPRHQSDTQILNFLSLERHHGRANKRNPAIGDTTNWLNSRGRSRSTLPRVCLLYPGRNTFS